MKQPIKRKRDNWFWWACVLVVTAGAVVILFTPVKGKNVPISMQVMLASFIMGCFSFVLCIMLSEEHQGLI